MKKKRIAVAVVVGLILVAVLLKLLVFRPSAAGVIEASGVVETTEADLGFQTSGRVEEVLVSEGDRVETGAELAWLDRSELQARRRAAEAQVSAAKALLAELEHGFRSEEIEQGRSALRAAAQRASDAERDLERTRRLYDGGAVSRQALDNAETALTLAKADHERAQEQMEILETGPRRERVEAQRSAVAQAEAALSQIDASLAFAVIRAPFAGVVTVRHREPGEIVAGGAPVLTLMQPDDRWIRIFVAEDEVGKIALGQAATITADADPRRTYTGEVVFIASEAEFTPRNVQTTKERVKLVYRVKVRITGDPEFDLKPGLAADVRLDVGKR